MRTWIKNALAVTTLAVGVGGTIVYNNYLSPIINEEKVVLATHNLNMNAVIGPNDVKVVRVRREVVVQNAVSDPAAVIGKMVSEKFVPNQQFTAQELETAPYGFSPDERGVDLKSQYLALVAPYLRTGDKVDIYLAKGSAQPTASSGTTGNQLEGQALTNFLSSNQPVLENILVESVQNSSNQEVVNVPPASHAGGVLGDRQNGSAMPSDVSLKVKKEDFESKLLPYIQAGGQFILVYSPNK